MLKIFFYVCLIYRVNIAPTAALVKNFYWREYVPGDVPCDAYEGAPGRYVGQILVGPSRFHVAATIYTSSSTALSEYGGKQVARNDIKILCSPENSRFYWDYVDFDKPNDVQLQDAVNGGYEGTNNLFIGKVLHDGEWKISKTLPYEYGSMKGLWVWKGDKENANLHQFFILKYNITEICNRECHSSFIG